ncbi:fumarylacetoacetate hydrolase family protein [Neobacillus terrae]|uniref:fumarylacetoacetate hydrolase family protein n=1 Tax=Neobacillus terrae TaxID=3034837 RepID=UPI00140A21D9|nr:fumarylacetoacetate hydrolase family protein [Neobacillus terrae]
MKLVQFKKNNEIRLGVKTDLGVLDLKDAGGKFEQQVPENMQELISLGQDGIQAVNAVVQRAVNQGNKDNFLLEGEIHFAPVVSSPDKIICVGLNYINHAKESKMDVPTSPILFSKFNNALAAHGETVKIPQYAEQMDYEAELVLVIGKTAQNVSEEEALAYVFGYTIGNDVSARDLQFKTNQWLLGKSPDGFAPIGPFLVTSDEIDPMNLTVECRVNGEVRQKGNTKDMIFNCAAIISYASKYMTLKPGDIIFTGTPDGVILGYEKEKQKWLQPGDVMVITIEPIGELKNVLQ